MNNDSQFSNFEACLIIMNTYELYLVRKSFNNYVDMKNFYMNKHEIYNYVDKSKVKWNELYRYLMNDE